MIGPMKRKRWVLRYLLRETAILGQIASVNILDKDFVSEYVEYTGADVCRMCFGADVCRALGRDFSALYKSGDLRRMPVGINSPTSGGWPKWVYDYRLADPNLTANLFDTTLEQMKNYVNRHGRHMQLEL